MKVSRPSAQCRILLIRRAPAALGHDPGYGTNRRNAQGRRLPPDPDGPRQAGPRLVQKAMRGSRLHNHGGRRRQHVRAPRPGKRSDIDPIGIGSHLDTQPTGGKFDGVLGVLGGLEVLRTLNDAGYETNAPLLPDQLDQRGGLTLRARHAGLGRHAGVFDQRVRRIARLDRQGISFADAIEADRLPRECEDAGRRGLGALFELHIE